MRHSPLVILIADQDLGSTRRLRAELRRRGAQVLTASSAEETIHQAALDPPDVVILDADLGLSNDEPSQALLQTATAKARLILLGREESAVREHLGQQPLFSTRKPPDEKALLGVIDTAFPGRLRPAATPWRDRGPILCVDDDPSHLRSLSRFLHRRGYQVAGFESGPRALEAFPRLHPEMAIVDIMMPGMDGLALAEKLRALSGDKMPIMLLTALDTDEAYYQAHEHGARYFLSKPCEPQKLLDIVDYVAGDLDDEERNLLRPGQ
jgi:DNA-binding response OmpR family regulator